MALKLKTYRIGSARRRGEGLRVSVARFLPRGVRKADYGPGGYFDVWYPVLAPSRELLQWVHAQPDLAQAWPKFSQRYRRELLGNPDSRHTLELIAALAKRTPIAIGCYCADEAHCHRSVLKQLIEAAA
jgi:uncharacterized protein YeaO (DUF488 family)